MHVKIWLRRLMQIFLTSFVSLNLCPWNLVQSTVFIRWIVRNSSGVLKCALNLKKTPTDSVFTEIPQAWQLSIQLSNVNEVFKTNVLNSPKTDLYTIIAIFSQHTVSSDTRTREKIMHWMHWMKQPISPMSPHLSWLILLTGQQITNYTNFCVSHYLLSNNDPYNMIHFLQL